jgi:hypothetical protein
MVELSPRCFDYRADVDPVLIAPSERLLDDQVFRAASDDSSTIVERPGQQFPVASEVFCFSVKNAAITAGVS